MKIHALSLVSLLTLVACGSVDPTEHDTASTDTAANTDTNAIDTANNDTAPAEPCSGARPWITLPLRLHLLSSNVPNFNATTDEAFFLLALNDANTRLAQACVRFELESSLSDPLSLDQEANFRAEVQAGITGRGRSLLLNAMPTANLLDPGFNAMVFPSFGPIPSVGLYLTDLHSVLWAEASPNGQPNDGAILAHELGHSLGLMHYTGASPENNLMDQDILQHKATALALTEEQISLARAQAATGTGADAPGE